MRGARFAQDRVFIDGLYIKVADRTPQLLAQAERAGTLSVHDQPYMKPGYDRRRWTKDGDYLGVVPL